MSEPSITCPVCQWTSYNPNDVSAGYCGHCHDYTGAIVSLALRELSEPTRIDLYDRQAHHITLGRFSWLQEGSRTPGHPAADYVRVAQDTIGLYWVSTVWLGTDMSFGLITSPPIIFETMVFLEGTPIDMGMKRYATEAQALAGHEATCAEIREAEARVAREHPGAEQPQHNGDPEL